MTKVLNLQSHVLARKIVEELCVINVGIISPQLPFATSIAQ